jgi:hypothetical protein
MLINRLVFMGASLTVGSGGEDRLGLYYVHQAAIAKETYDTDTAILKTSLRRAEKLGIDRSTSSLYNCLLLRHQNV